MKNLTLLILLIFAGQLSAQKWTPEDIINTERMSSVQISSDNSKVLWTKKEDLKKKDKFIYKLYLTYLNEHKTIQLTFGESSESNPQFSQDGMSIYFQSSRDDKTKLYKMSLLGGEAQEVATFENGLSSAKVIKSKVYFLASEGKTLRDIELKEKKDNVIVVEDSTHWKSRRLFRYNMDNKSTERLTDNEKPLSWYSVSEDENWIVYAMQRSRSYASDALKDPYIYLKNLQTGELKRILSEFEYPVYSVKFNTQSSGFYFTSTQGNQPKYNGAGVDQLFYFNLKDQKSTQVDLKWELGLGRGYQVGPNGIIVSLANKTDFILAYYQVKGATWSKKEIDFKAQNRHVNLLAWSKDGSTLIYDYSTASRLPSYHSAAFSKGKISDVSTVTQLNKSLSKKAITKSEVITWKGYNNDEVTGILYYPENYQEGNQYPLVLSIHGGPSAADYDLWSERWSTYPQILAQKGAFVLKPNYHGSSNHGLAYVESIFGNYYEPEMVDIKNAIDKLNSEGKIDMDKLGTMGWSNGAILTTMLTLKYPDMFKVAAAGAGDVNWTSDYGTCRFGVSFDQTYFGGAPWDDVNGKTYNENYILKSPLFEIEKIKTPTIIFHGSEDRAVPRDQGWEYYRGLQQVGQTPVRFLWFPGQPHGLGKITHQLRKMNEEIAWIDHYLFDTHKPSNETFKKGSPLDKLLKVEQAKITENGAFGETFKGTLIPELQAVKKDSLMVAVFELTHAQYQAFDGGHEFDKGLDNYPVELSRVQAENYIKWLQKLTGQNYRMPNAQEAAKFHEQAYKNAAKGLTLNYWAGYDLTIDEIPAFKAKASSASTLLKKVGKRSKNTLGKATLYDLGGNLAEYYDTGVYDYSAYDFRDPFNSSMIASEHVGLRLVLTQTNIK
ncbi:S9 family peptidase [Flavobacteriaceae bacterium]|nr:S9 family peptidase [Flavobacteriaceae bacterium]